MSVADAVLALVPWTAQKIVGALEVIKLSKKSRHAQLLQLVILPWLLGLHIKNRDFTNHCTDQGAKVSTDTPVGENAADRSCACPGSLGSTSKIETLHFIVLTKVPRQVLLHLLIKLPSTVIVFALAPWAPHQQ
jgi:hypothetical protein